MCPSSKAEDFVRDNDDVDTARRSPRVRPREDDAVVDLGRRDLIGAITINTTQ